MLLLLPLLFVFLLVHFCMVRTRLAEIRRQISHVSVSVFVFSAQEINYGCCVCGFEGGRRGDA